MRDKDRDTIDGKKGELGVQISRPRGNLLTNYFFPPNSMAYFDEAGWRKHFGEILKFTHSKDLSTNFVFIKARHGLDVGGKRKTKIKEDYSLFLDLVNHELIMHSEILATCRSRGMNNEETRKKMEEFGIIKREASARLREMRHSFEDYDLLVKHGDPDMFDHLDLQGKSTGPQKSQYHSEYRDWRIKVATAETNGQFDLAKDMVDEFEKRLEEEGGKGKKK